MLKMMRAVTISLTRLQGFIWNNGITLRKRLAHYKRCWLSPFQTGCRMTDLKKASEALVRASIRYGDEVRRQALLIVKRCPGMKLEEAEDAVRRNTSGR